jgi:stage V sporulation protein B
MASSSVIRGYFIAKRHAGLLTISSIAEEGISIAFSLILLRFSSLPSYICLIASCTGSNFCAFVLDSFLMRSCLKKGIFIPAKARFKDIFAICVPIALGSYLRTGLVSCENLIIPMQFARYGTPDPVAEYGIIKAMAMPLLMFPTVFVQAFSSMLVPEMSEMNAKGRPNGIRHVSQISLNAVTLFAFFISLMLFKHHDIISASFYKEKGVSFYLGTLSLLAVPMYLDTVADSILKGLNLQNASLKYNIADSVLRIISILIFMPRFGPVFYIIMLYISEIFNLALSLNKAARTMSLRIDFASLLFKPFVCAFAAFWFSSPLLQTAVYLSLYFAIDIVKTQQNRHLVP